MARHTRSHRRSNVHFASVTAVEDYAAEVSTQALICRDERHRWDLYDIEGDTKHGFTRFYKCACGAMKVQELDALGYIMDTKMSYPEGYQLPRGTGRLSQEGNAILRQAAAQQAMARINMELAGKQAS